MQKLKPIALTFALLLTLLLTLSLAYALEGNDSSGNTIRYATGYITFNSTDSSTRIQAFGDYISNLIQDINFLGWLSQLAYNFFPPTKPDLYLPLNNTYFNYTPIFYWSNTTDPEKLPVSYLFEVYNDSSLTEINYVNYSITETLNTTSETSATINGEGTFYWRVAANDSDYNSSFSDPRTLILDTTLPTNFNLTSPADATSTTDTTPELAWDASTDTNLDNYTIEITTNSTFSEINLTEVSETNSFLNWSSPLEATTYYWRVSAVDKANNQRLSDNNLSFTVQPTATETIISGPAGTETAGGGSKPFTLNIIAPEGVTVYANDVITIPLLIINPSTLQLRGIKLQVSSDEPGIIPSLDSSYISELSALSQTKILLTLNTANVPIGTYGITLDALVVSPTYQDQFKLFANLLEKDTAGSAETLEQIDFAKQLFNGNPECLDLSEYLTEAELALQQGKIDKALNLAENAVAACNKLLTQRKAFERITTQAALITKVKSTLTNKTFIIIAPQFLGLILILVILLHFLRKKKKK